MKPRLLDLMALALTVLVLAAIVALFWWVTR